MKLPARIPLGTFPTPLDPLPRLSAELGVEVLAKRDDLTGLALGGNKIRKLEMLLADAVAQGADAVVTCGAVQSNHCRCTAAAAARLGLECGLVLFEGRHNENGNLLLDELFGATVEHHPVSARDRSEELMAALGKRYRKPYVIPFGGSNALGAAAYAWCYEELREQLGGRGGTLFCVTSSGATHAGLAMGQAMLGGPTVLGVSNGDPVMDCQRRLGSLIAYGGELIGLRENVVTTVVDGFQGEGYGIPSPRGAGRHPPAGEDRGPTARPGLHVKGDGGAAGARGRGRAAGDLPPFRRGAGALRLRGRVDQRPPIEVDHRRDREQ